MQARRATAAGLRDNVSLDEAKSIVRDVENHVKKVRAKRQDRATAEALAAIERDLARLRVGF